jgi:hypothetical protein
MAEVIQFPAKAGEEPAYTAEDVLTESFGLDLDTVIVMGRAANGDFVTLSNMGRLADVYSTLLFAMDVVLDDAITLFDCGGEPN